MIVVALDRLGRSLSGIIRTIEKLAEAGVQLRSLRESIDTTTAVGRMLAGVFGALAEYERSLINERSAAACEAARVRGRAVGRPKALRRTRSVRYGSSMRLVSPCLLWCARLACPAQPSTGCLHRT